MPIKNINMFRLGSLRAWLWQFLINKGCDREYITPAILTTLSRLATVHFRLIGKNRFSRIVKSIILDKPPMFIIGHWRSGTTYLHNLMICDKNLGYMNLMQSIAPEMAIDKNSTLKEIIAQCTPPRRPMDNITLTPNVPQEEEFAMANMTACSFYHQWVFPRSARQYFEKYALLNNISRKDFLRWQQTYLLLLRKITVNAGGRRIILKNPVNTGRISILIELFPDAKFIHVYRDPFVVFPSTLNLYEKMLEMSQVQKISQEEIERNILLFYERLLKKYFMEKDLIPPGNLVEIRFEDLEADPLFQLHRIYDTLNLPGFGSALPDFKKYITSQAGYSKNAYTLDRDTIEKIGRKWRTFIDIWGYSPPKAR